VNGEIDIPAFG